MLLSLLAVAGEGFGERLSRGGRVSTGSVVHVCLHVVSWRSPARLVGSEKHVKANLRELTGRRSVLAQEADRGLALSKTAGGGEEHVGELRNWLVVRRRGGVGEEVAEMKSEECARS